MPVSLVDSHCHIPMISLDGGTQAVLDNAAQHNVDTMLCVCIDLPGFPAILDLAKGYGCIYASVGIHPNTEQEKELSVSALTELADHPRIIAIGETGLDYFRSEGDLDWQRDRFRDHIRAAREIKKPLIVHCRDAREDVLTILKEEKAEAIGGVMHCFVEDLETARRAIDLNFCISFSGIVTFKNATDLKAVAREVPAASILIETDSPYLAPVPYRGRQNQPAYVRYVAEQLAELRQISLEELAELTTSNFNKLFISK